jgi:hypothetical protein
MPLRQEVSNFISACEAIHSLLSDGETLSEDEIGVIEISTRELKSRIWPENGTNIKAA